LGFPKAPALFSANFFLFPFSGYVSTSFTFFHFFFFRVSLSHQWFLTSPFSLRKKVLLVVNSFATSECPPWQHFLPSSRSLLARCARLRYLFPSLSSPDTSRVGDVCQAFSSPYVSPYSRYILDSVPTDSLFFGRALAPQSCRAILLARYVRRSRPLSFLPQSPFLKSKVVFVSPSSSFTFSFKSLFVLSPLS